MRLNPRLIPTAFAVAVLLVALPTSVRAQSSPHIMTGCFLLERLDGEDLPLPSPFEILLIPSSGGPQAEPEAVTQFPAVAQQASPRQVRGTWMGRAGRRSAFFEFSVFAGRLRGTIWLTEDNDEPLPHEVDARPTPCPEPTPPV